MSPNWLEEERALHEDLERLEQGMADRLLDEPNHIRIRLNRDHEVAKLADEMQKQSKRLVNSYRANAKRKRLEIEKRQTGDSFVSFYAQLNELRERHADYPNEQAENVEMRYKPKRGDDGPGHRSLIVDSIFSGEEAYGRFFDLHSHHGEFLNLPNVKRMPYLQYLECFDDFVAGQGGLKRVDKITEKYLKYVTELAEYLESFRKRTRPLEDTSKLMKGFDNDFDKAWSTNEVPGWEAETSQGVWCADCQKLFGSQSAYSGHLTGRKHIRNAKERAEREAAGGPEAPIEAPEDAVTPKRSKEREIAQQENRVKKLAASMSVERSDTRVNVERKQGMTERERLQELDNLLDLNEGSAEATPGAGEVEVDEDGEEKIYNPLKLPLAWDGKPIPFWLYRLHGLGVEFHCEVCGNFVYMGRRAFDKHFSEPRHIYGLKCLGITNVALFRDITKIEEALKLWEKLQQEEKKSKVDEGSIVQMEDAEGNVMPEKVYNDLQKQGLL